MKGILSPFMLKKFKGIPIASQSEKLRLIQVALHQAGRTEGRCEDNARPSDLD